MPLLSCLFTREDPRQAMAPLYRAIVEQGRRPQWYLAGGVPDTLDGRFDMVAAILSLVLLRLEQDGAAKQESVWLTELFIDDMDGQLRQIGIGDLVVGKHVGRMMGALGGRLTVYREALVESGPLEPALERNLYRGDPPAPQQLAWTAQALRQFWLEVQGRSTAALLAGELVP
jgi:cytochrome b pre-mRNA-processing protein 3